VSYLVVQTSSGSGRPEGDRLLAPAQESIAISMPSPWRQQPALPATNRPATVQIAPRQPHQAARNLPAAPAELQITGLGELARYSLKPGCAGFNRGFPESRHHNLRNGWL